MQVLERLGNTIGFLHPTGASAQALGAIFVVLTALFAWHRYLDLRQRRLLLTKTAPPSDLVEACRQADSGAGTDAAAFEGVSADDVDRPVLDWMDIKDSKVLAEARERTAKKNTFKRRGQLEQVEDKDDADDDDDDEDDHHHDNTSDAEEEDDSHLPAVERLQRRFGRSVSYGLDKSTFGLVSSGVSMTATLLVLLSGATAGYWRVATHGADMAVNTLPSLLGPSDSLQADVVRACLFAAVSSLLDLAVSWPLSLYFTFVLQERHGFNRQTLRLWLVDQLKSLALTAVLGSLIIAVVVTILRNAGPWLPLYLWLALAAIQLVAMLVFPTLIQPLFNTFEQLPDGPLRRELEQLAEALSFPSKSIAVVDGTTRSSHSNAYVTGFGPAKRITVFDSLLSQLSLPEARAVVGHELGHWKHGHLYLLLLASLLQSGAVFALYALAADAEPLYTALGFEPGAAPAFVRLLIFMELGLAPLSPLLSFANALLSRALEYDADAFAVQLGLAEPLKRGLVKLSLENLSSPWIDPLYSAYHFTHPPLPDRIAAINTLQKKRD